jgi:hypothetical protein
MTITKLVFATIIGFALMFVMSIAGCGSVVVMNADAGDAGTAGRGAAGVETVGMETAGMGIAGMTAPDAGHDLFLMVEHPETDGDAGTTGIAGTGAAGSTVPGRPLGVGCTSDDQCGSSICAKVVETDTAGVCCNGRPDTCSVCVGGYRTIVQDGTSIDACRMCRGGQIMALADGTSAGACNTCVAGKVTALADGTICARADCYGDSVPLNGVPYYRSSRSHVCSAGLCVPMIRDCRTVLTCAGGASQNCGSSGFCASDASNHGDCACGESTTPIVCGYPSP